MKAGHPFSILLATLLSILVVPAHAQSTKAQLNSEITTRFPDNTVGAITLTGLRMVTADIVNSIMPTAPVVPGNLACFNGTTGLLQDCGIPPSTLVIGTTQITAGVSTRVLYDNGGFIGEYPITGTGNVAMSASPTFSGTIGAANANFSGVISIANASATTGTADEPEFRKLESEARSVIEFSKGWGGPEALYLFTMACLAGREGPHIAGAMTMIARTALNGKRN